MTRPLTMLLVIYIGYRITEGFGNIGISLAAVALMVTAYSVREMRLILVLAFTYFFTRISYDTATAFMASNDSGSQVEMVPVAVALGVLVFSGFFFYGMFVKDAAETPPPEGGE